MEFLDVVSKLLSGFGVTLHIFIATLILSLPLGLLIAFGSMSRFSIVKSVIKGFIWVIRGTPLMLQIIIVFYGPGLVFDIPMKSRFLAVIIAFVINYSCYFSEIFRGGIESMSKGQYEAGKILGLSKSQTFFHIILPQVIKRIVPPMSNEIITLVKDTSLARCITVIEIIKEAEEIVSIYGIIWPLFFTGVFYLLFNGLLTILFGHIEKKLSYYN